ncbi:hypothetical protein ACXHQ0_19595 [Vibrio antiquarius]|uniref:Uncharacterized protein n=1 Tax=Vibrio parahaemolyticus TaxID=670 RepID=A0AA46Z919_VIBPH|nr:MULTISPECIES: hypothetical protein [Vibrio harveyi group]EGR3229182.1 hypothetical protein [Vibrio parahaemolyticus]EGR5927976.1 hypothetical protein [Vibrio parahaemolyticus]EJG0181194.1 hypothetical protein [Vibrio parahaemolyticus]KOE80532.1 hypothetical protein ACS91_22650 [Vibrio parahaemolyticus]KOY37937.1 hypothetical protein ACX10_11870 [Vibrio parahaemolyticus]
MDKKALLEVYLDEVYDKAEEVDPTGSQYWYSIVLGWAIGKGLEPEAAHDFAYHVIYETAFY